MVTRYAYKILLGQSEWKRTRGRTTI
jgi:hypothetical protein